MLVKLIPRDEDFEFLEDDDLAILKGFGSVALIAIFILHIDVSTDGLSARDCGIWGVLPKFEVSMEKERVGCHGGGGDAASMNNAVMERGRR
ncbi:hypothetical protein CDL15_Pgr026664 [Punica granatum]|uniref:Uncharacterized protein n=1 Tax=Punica granatum TaxID=22663 RepID=A0A218WL95_PUNGR|nr:hypothetical protein CDL15_Pgr026664 [Punica granatum]